MLYGLLKPSTIDEKIEIYESFKQCIPYKDHMDIKIYKLFDDITQAFTQCINEKIANVILKSFKYVIKEEEVKYFLSYKTDILFSSVSMSYFFLMFM